MLGPLSFATPALLLALGLLPFLWKLLRMVPPAPRRSLFPAIILLAGLRTDEESPATTPLWLVLLRMALAALVIVGAAHPRLLAPPAGVVAGPLLVVVDNGWSAAKFWPERRAAMDALIDQADRAARPVLLLATAAGADAAPPVLAGPLPAGVVKPMADALEPHPWPVDRAAAVRALAQFTPHGPMRIVWLADGIEDGAGPALEQALSRLGSLEILRIADEALPKLVVPPRSGDADVIVRLRRAGRGGAETVTVAALDGAGRALARQPATLAAGDTEGQVRFDLPGELRNRIARFSLEGEATAGAMALLDERWRRHPVGLMDDSAAGQGGAPLLDDLFYSARALAPLAEVRRAPLAELLKRDLSLIVVADAGTLPDDAVQQLGAWVEKGGLLLRIAGPDLAKGGDSLLPVRLRSGGRMFGGAMSWTAPMRLAPMPDSGPFRGLAVPDDVRVSAQVLAEPGVDLDGQTWARLADGTPLVTGAARGKGWIVLIHTTVGPAWSNLGLSGLYPDLLRRLIALSQGVEGGPAGHALAPAEQLDGYGQLVAPAAAVEAVRPDLPAPPIGPRHPPGYYGDEAARISVNLGADSPPMKLLPRFSGVPTGSFEALDAGRDLQPALLLAALLLLVADMVAILAWRGGLRLRRRPAALGLLLLLAAAGLGIGGKPAAAAQLKAALEPSLAYVTTGNAAIDDVSRAGLKGLSQILARRTTAVLGEPAGVDPGRDPLTFYPLLYWPVTPGQGPLPAAARQQVNAYMHRGGMVLFDLRSDAQGGSASLRALAEGLDIPPLVPLAADHVLTRSYYLLSEWPGRLAGGTLYVQEGGDPANDDVSPVVIGSNDWAGAWAVDKLGEPLLPVAPGGERQREMAYRFGVNLVMYALTGSYKADQVHLPAILERLRR